MGVKIYTIIYIYYIYYSYLGSHNGEAPGHGTDGEKLPSLSPWPVSAYP